MNGHKFEFEVLDRRGGDRVLLLIYIYIVYIYECCGVVIMVGGTVR